LRRRRRPPDWREWIKGGIATGIGSVVAIATDATNVYWVDSTLQQIAKTTKY
jgi:hypothetical protein